MVNNKHILIVEDEQKIARLLQDYLHANQFQSTMMHQGDGVTEWVKQYTPDLLLLDVMLPGKDGMDICREIRQFSTVPIIMITARIEEIDRILGLEIGADDYICKPFSPREVIARIKVIFRRLSSSENHSDNDETSTLSRLQINDDAYEVYFDQSKLDLTPVEFRLIQTLNDKPGKVFSRNQLMSRLYDDNRIVTDRTIDTHVKNLRKKLTAAGAQEETIHSIYGVGYKLEPSL